MMSSHPGDRRTTRAIASTPYDTAWVAAVPHPNDRRDPRFPSALSWIAGQQLSDGSWGSAVPYLHDRIICTLAALIPLARYGRRDSDRGQVRDGERYLWQHAHLLTRDPCELVGFELLLPALIDAAQDAGVQVPTHMHAFGAERQAKLSLLPQEMIYSPRVTIAHSLEFLGTSVDPQRLLATRAPNGSIGNSPAATAFLLHHIDDPAAVAYLTRCLSGDQGDAVPVLEPCETFEALWTAYHQWLGGVPATMLFTDQMRHQLREALSRDGVSLSPSFPVPDADDTAVALLLLHAAGIAVEPTALRQFERDEYFVSFPYERHPSVGVNVHVLQALSRYPAYPQRDRAVERILAFLNDSRQHQTYWLDKWHISPLYATSRAVIALSSLPAARVKHYPDLIERAVEWMLQIQNADGSWGFQRTPTAEETAYALLALQHLPQQTPRIRAAIAAGQQYLQIHRDAPRPALWIDKCLYYPTRIVQAAIDAALGDLRTQPSVPA